jgi:hypothetical protein
MTNIKMILKAGAPPVMSTTDPNQSDFSDFSRSRMTVGSVSTHHGGSFYI